jgi:hypothetical protein
MYLNQAHGPEISIPGQQQKEVLSMLAYILTLCNLKSADPTSKNQMAGCWRHFYYLRCGAGAVAMNIFTTLHCMFYHIPFILIGIHYKQKA